MSGPLGLSILAIHTITGYKFRRFLNLSELHTRDWAKNCTGLAELLNIGFKDLPLVNFYRAIDKIYESRDQIERELEERQKELFHLPEKLLFYDLTAYCRPINSA